ncbi:hypothetical protein J6590_105993, partial [Homalodisca vitripennis]
AIVVDLRRNQTRDLSVRKPHSYLCGEGHSFKRLLYNLIKELTDSNLISKRDGIE